MESQTPEWLDEITFDQNGLIMAIAQDRSTDRILMAAWMNRESLQETVETGMAVYYSRTRNRIWRKGEASGHFQSVHEVRLDCDGDVLILAVDQTADIACHTGRNSCFFRVLKDGVWHTVDPVIKEPDEIYPNE